MLMHCLGKANSSVHFLNLTDFWQIRTSIEQKAAETPLQNICLTDVCLDGLTLQSIGPFLYLLHLLNIYLDLVIYLNVYISMCSMHKSLGLILNTV